MKYTPYTEAQIQSMNLMEEGIYIFEVLEVYTIDKWGQPMQDKNGNDLARLKLLIWDNENRERIIFTFISGDSNFAYKLRHYAQTIGMLSEYEEGIFDIVKTEGKTGKATIIIKKGNPKNDGSDAMWPDRNDVKDFVISELTAPSSLVEEVKKAFVDDDVPF